MDNKDNISTLYGALKSKGYEDIGNEDQFREWLNVPDNVNTLYSKLQENKFDDIGTQDEFSSWIGISSPSANVSAASLPVSAETNSRLEMDPAMQRARKRMDSELVPEINVMDNDKMATVPLVREESFVAGNARPIDTDRAMEEILVDSRITKQGELQLPKDSENNIITNYQNRFLQTSEGKRIVEEFETKRKELSERAMNAYLQSEEYKNLASRYSGEDLDKKANEDFERRYGTVIAQELQPLYERMNQSMLGRYKDGIEEELKNLGKENAAKQVESLSSDVSNMLQGRREALKRYSGSGNNAMNALMGSRRYSQDTQQERGEIATLEAARNFLQESQDIINEAREKGSSGALFRGLRDATFDVDTWTMGLSDMAHGYRLKEAADKADKGETLTVDEQKLLEAAAVNMAVHAYYSSDLSRMYKAGQTTGYSIPFMLEFAINPVSGSGNAIAKGILKYGMKKFGRSAGASTLNNFGKMLTSGVGRTAGRLIGDATAAAAMTGTSGLGRVSSGMLERMNGTINFDVNEEGRLIYNGREEQKGMGEALAKSAASNFLENQSEMVFNAFKGMGDAVYDTLDKVLPNGIRDFFSAVGSSEIGKLYKALKNNPTFMEAAKRTQFHGFVGEYMEEVYNNFANVPLGEMTMDEVLDLDNNIDTALGLAPTSVMFGLLGMGGMARERYNTRKTMEKAFGKLTPDQKKRLEELQQMSSKKGNEDIREFIKATIADESLTQEQKRDEIEYAFNIAKGNAIEDLTVVETEDNIEKATAYIEENSDRKEGMYKEASRRVFNVDTGNFDLQPGCIVGEMGGQPIWRAEGSTENIPLTWDDIDKDTMQQMPVDEVVSLNAEMIRDEAKAQAERETMFSPDIPEPAIGTSFLNSNGQQVQIVQQNPDGGWIGMAAVIDEKGQPETDKNGQPVMRTFPVMDDEYYAAMQARIDTQEGVKKMLSDGRTAVATSTNGEEVSFDILDNTGGLVDSGVMPFEEFDKLDNYIESPEVELTDEGIPTIDIMSEKRGKNAVSSPTEYNRMSDSRALVGRKLDSQEANNLITAMQDSADTAPELELTPENWTAEFGEDGIVDTPIGQVKMGENQLAKMFLKKRGNEFGMIKPTLTNPDLIIEEESEGVNEEVERATTLLFAKTFLRNGKKIRIFTSVTVQRDGMEVVVSNHILRDKQLTDRLERGKILWNRFDFGSDSSGKNQGLVAPYTNNPSNVGHGSNPQSILPLSDNKDSGVSGEKQELSTNNIGDEAEIQEQKPDLQEDIQPTGIPTDEKGNPLYYLAPIEVTLADLNDGSLASEEVDSFISANKAEALKLLKRVSEKPPKIGTNKAKYLADKQAWQAKVEDAQKQSDYWNEVEAQMRLLRQQPGDTTAEEIKAMGEPMTGEELAAMMLGAGKLPLLHSEYKRETGFGNTDAKKMFGLFASKEKGGMTIEQAGEKLMLADLEAGTNFFDQNDPNAGRNAIIDVLSSARTRGGLIDYIKSNREAMAERERQAEIEAEELAKEQWYQENYRMTPEEYELWNQGELFTESNVISDEEYQEFMSNFVDEILNEQGNDRRTSQESGSSFAESESNDQERVSGVRESSSPVLQGEEFVSTGTTGRIEEESGQVDANSSAEHDALQSSSSGRELISSSRSHKSVSDYVPSRIEGESLLDYANRVNDAHALHTEERKVDTNPTDAQKEAGNYRKGHIKVDGFNITIENPRGSERSGVDADGNTWSVTMNNTYGYIRGTEGVDGDHIDVFLGNSGNGVYVVDQMKEDGSFDEHKVMYGFDSLDEAREAYLSNYSPGWKGLGSITGVSKETFKEWVESSHRKTKPFADYKIVRERTDVDSEGSASNKQDNIRFREESSMPQEEQEIIDRAKKNGTYLMAPNGKPSSLGESQWVQVRTKAFKKWFGDWEKTVRIEKLRDSKAVEITGEEYQGKYELNRNSSKTWIKENLRGEYINKDTGEKIEVRKDGAQKVTSHSMGSEAHLKSLFAIPQLIENAIFIDEITNEKNNGKYDSYRYYVCGLNIGGAEYTVKVTVGVKGASKYYDHALTEIEKGNLIDNIDALSTTFDNNKDALSFHKDTKLLSILQTNSSKVVDENGEPLVVFHGTPLRRDQITSNRGWQKDGFTYISQEAPFYTFKGGEYSGMIFTSVDAEKARSIAEKRAMSILDDENGKEQWTDEGYVYDLFANIRKPFVSSSDYEPVLALFGNRIPTLSFIGGKGEMVSLDEAKSILKSGNSWLVTETPQFVEKIKELGFDGVIGTDEGIKYIACFGPNQLKDAYDNTGEFSSENDDIRFREVREKDGSKSLVGLHNISEEKLLKALKLGGFANPSAAVIDIDRQSHEGYGEISLVLPSSMVAKSTGHNAGTFSGDAWTPTYPQIERQFTDEGSKRVYDDISKLPQEMQPDVRSAWNNYMEGRDANALAYQFLYEKGEAPELRKIEPVFSENIRKKVRGADAIDDYDNRNAAILEAYIDEKFDGDRAKFEEYIETRKRVLRKKIDEDPSQKGFTYRRAVENLKDIEVDGYEYSSVKRFYDEVMSDIRNSGGIDTYQTVRDVQEKISQSAELSKEYDEWKENLTDKYGIKEVLFKGYTPSGNRVYLPHTLENVSRLMRQQGLAGATGWGGSFSKFAAGLMKPVGTLNSIRKQKGKLTTDHEDLEAFREKWEKVYFDLGLKLNPGASAYDDTGLYRVEEIATRSNPKSFAKREYGVELSDEDVRQLEEMTEAIRNDYPAMYFETKFERPVYLNEFAAVVLPDNVNPKVIGAARDAGLQIFSYESGDEVSRDEAVKKASKIDGVRFRDMRTYHGSGAYFDRFDTSHSGEGQGENMIGKGVYTTESKRIAKNYADVARNKDADGKKHLYEVNIPKDNGRNYLDYDRMYNAKEREEVTERLHNAGIDISKSLEGYFHGREVSGMNLYRALSMNMPQGTDINEALSKAGYVGYKYSTRHDLGGKNKLFSKKSYVVFDEGNAIITGHEQIVSEIEKLSDTLHSPVKVVRSMNELPEGMVRRAIEKGRNVKGWFDTRTGEVVIYLPNTTGEEDAKATFLHEIVGHKGLRALLGEKEYDQEMVKLYGQLPLDVRKSVAEAAVRDYGGNVAIAMDEYLAEQAEKDETPSWWNKVVSGIRNFLRRMGIKVDLNANDVKYLLWRSRKALENGDILEQAEDIAMRYKLGIGEHNNSLLHENYENIRKEIEHLQQITGRNAYLARNEDELCFQMSVDGFSAKDIDYIRFLFEDARRKGKKSPGFFDNETGKVYLCADQINDRNKARGYWFHEEGHASTLLNFSQTELEALYDSIGENTIMETVPSIYFEEKLSKSILADEYISYLMEEIASDEELFNSLLEGKVDEVLEELEFPSIAVVPFISKNLKLILYGKEKKNNRENRSGHGLRSLSSEKTGMEARGGTEEEGRIRFQTRENFEDEQRSEVIIKAVDEFATQYAGAGEVIVIRSKETIGKQLESFGVSESEIAELEELMEAGDVPACYNPKTGIIVVLNTNVPVDRLNSYLWHENTHKALVELFGDNKHKAIEPVYQWLESRQPESCKYVRSLYSETCDAVQKEECVVRFFEEMFFNHGSMRLKDIIDNANPVCKEFYSQIYDKIVYESKKESRSDGRSSSGLGSRYKKEWYESMVRNPISSRESEKTGRGGTEEEGSIRFRTGENGEDRPSDGTVESYEKALNKRGLTGFRAQEASQDSMLSLKILQDIILAKDGGKIKSFEDAYKAENRMSSVSTREMEVYAKDYFRPVVEEVARIIRDEDTSYVDVTDYLIAKHGLERNVALVERDAAAVADKTVKEKIDSAYKELKNYHISQDEYNKVVSQAHFERDNIYKDELEKNQGKDYSGLTGLKELRTGEKSKDKDYIAFAEAIVSDFESKHNTDELWSHINNATNQSLRKTYESGLMSKEQYESLLGRFEYYVPLRGWDETMADEVYEYMDKQRSPVNSVLKNAKGRISLADDPIAAIGNMAESTILQGNRNLMKQNFLNFVINHPSDLAQVRELWYVKDNTTGEFVPSFPDISENASPEEIAYAVDEHEETMKHLEKDGLAKRGRNGLELKYKILPFQKSEHVVMVKRNGKDVVIYINADPRAAQAINGLTNPDVENNPILKAVNRFNRMLAANFTTRNPAFVISNLSRDMIFATSAVAVKESPMYLARFSTNIPIAIAAVFRGIRKKGGNSEADKYFQEFLDNGGETGYAQLTTVDKYKKMIQKDINRLTKTDYFGMIRNGIELLEDFNRMAEDISRFTTYMTSRQEGRNILEAINDAKEITVNFNKKGAGYKSLNQFEKWYSAGNLVAYSTGVMKNLYLFFNVGVQSLFNFGRLHKKSVKKFGAMLGGFTSAGFMMPLINTWLMALGGDDKDGEDYYGNLSDWTRRNNLCLYIPGSHGHFVTIPLPIELRAFFGLGDMAYQETIGEGSKNGTEIAYDAINQLTELLPLNPLGNNGDIVSTVMPDAIKPFWQVVKNEDYTGRPIYKSNSFNKTMPKWTKTYKGTSKQLIKLAEWSNELGGGDKYKTSSAIFDWNPAVIEHILEGYFGGMATIFNQSGKTMMAGIESVIDGERSDDLIWRNTPVLSRFINDASDERSGFRKFNESFYKYLDEYQETEKLLHGYTKEVLTGNLDYLDKLVELQKSKDYVKYSVFKNLNQKVDKIRQLEKKVGDGNNKDLRKQINELKKKVVEEMEKVK